MKLVLVSFTLFYSATSVCIIVSHFTLMFVGGGGGYMCFVKL